MSTGIAWTDATYNPVRARHKETGQIGHACVRVSDGCKHCYAATDNVEQRFLRKDGSVGTVVGTGEDYTVGGLARVELFLDEQTLLQPLRWRKPRMVFLHSMTDTFWDQIPDAWIDRIFAVMALTPQHIYQVLTKRPERMREYLRPRVEQALLGGGHMPGEDIMWREGPAAARIIHEMAEIDRALAREPVYPRLATWPLPNVWLGVSVEDQPNADARIPLLIDTPAAVRFLSCEPLLGPIDISRHMWPVHPRWPSRYRSPEEAIADGAEVTYHRQGLVLAAVAETFIDWVIAGGESGKDARFVGGELYAKDESATHVTIGRREPPVLDWLRSIRDQCFAADVPYFLKQLGGTGKGARGQRAHEYAELDGRTWTQMPTMGEGA